MTAGVDGDDAHRDPGRRSERRSPMLLHLTDTHLCAAADGIFRGVAVAGTLRSVCTMAIGRDGPFDAVLMTGDLVQDEVREAYQRLRTIVGALGLPVHCVAGNHDDPALMNEMLSQPPFDCNDHVDLQDWRIIMLDSHESGEVHGAVSAAELDRLDTLLADARHALVCLHHHVLPVGSRWLDPLGVVNAAELLAVIDRHSSPRGVLWGHVHQAFEQQRRGVRYMASPSTCAQFKPNSPEYAIDRRPPGYRVLELRPDGAIRSTVRWLESAADGATPSGRDA